MRLLIVGRQGGTNIGQSFCDAATQAGMDVSFLDMDEAFNGPFVWRKIAWHLLGKQPLGLSHFGEKLMNLCVLQKPDCIITAGVAPIGSTALSEIRRLKILILNYLTDDPWNPSHKARWFLKALPLYDHVFSVRRSNIEDLKRIGCRNVHYLPFGYDPSLSYPQRVEPEEEVKYASDILFVGGADRDRVPYISALVAEGFKVRLYGSYWERFKETKKYTQGQVSPEVLRKATACARVSLCLVRRANRDGNVMRSFEIPASGGCMLAEDTEEHRAIFGEEGRAVLYFKNIAEMIEKTRYLLTDENKRKALAKTAHDLILQSKHTYEARLKTMIAIATRKPL
jgi:spore maturation protein CgeB